MTIRVAKHRGGSKLEYVVYVGRTKAAGKKHSHAFHELANLFRIGPDGTREEVVEKYQEWLIKVAASPSSAREQLLALTALYQKHGKLVLVCHCINTDDLDGYQCHAQVISRLVQEMAGLIEEPKVQYCANDPCETEAIKMVCDNSGKRLPLCYTCAQAYEWGQASPDAEMFDMDNEGLCGKCGAPIRDVCTMCN